MATEYLGRSAWADSDWPRGGAQLTGAILVGIADHWPGTTQNVIGDPGREAIRNRLRSYYEFHTNKVTGRGWSDIGYNFAIDQGGRVWDLRGLSRVGAHAASNANPDANHEFLGVLFIVGDEEELSDAAIRAFQDFYHDVFLPRWPGRNDIRSHGDVPGAQTACAGPFVQKVIDSGVLSQKPSGGGTPPADDDEVVIDAEIEIDLAEFIPVLEGASLSGTVLTMNLAVPGTVRNGSPEPPGGEDPPDEEEPPVIPPRPADGQWEPGVAHSSFALMGYRLKEWLSNSEISRAGSVYNPGPRYSHYDDFNVRKIQALMGNSPDPVGEAFLGPKQWTRLFSEDRPHTATLPDELKGQVPPQLRGSEPEPPSLPELPDRGAFTAGITHPSFTAMGERFNKWLSNSEISRVGSAYNPGPRFSHQDDFNIRKIQHLMGNTPDPAGKAYFGPKQWERLFAENRPAGTSLPKELQGQTPPQVSQPAPAPPPPKVPSLPPSSAFTPGTSHSSFTAMGERFLKWLKSDEIHKAGSVYTPGPRYSIYDERNVRAVQHLMGNTPDPEGKAFLGPKQWERLFTESRPSGATLPSSLKPGGSGGGGGGSTTNVPVAGRRITQHFGVKNTRYAANEHTGVDFGSNGRDDTIRCTGSGTVVYVDNRSSATSWGRRVIVRHGNGRYSWYCHLASVSVKVGQKVSRGTKLGTMGNSSKDQPMAKHLHYQESVGGYGYWDYKKPTMLGFSGY